MVYTHYIAITPPNIIIIIIYIYYILYEPYVLTLYLDKLVHS